MKTFFLLGSMAACFILGCSAANQGSVKGTEIQSISLKQITRGYQKEVLITPNNLTFTHNGNTETMELAAGVWETLAISAAEIDLEGMSEMVSPTNDRIFDGAKIGSLEIAADDQTYQHQFDNLLSHEDLQEFVDEVVSACQAQSVDFP